MRIYTQLADLPTPPTPVVATIGNFDGVHLGHRSVIAEVIARARALSAQSLAITFDPHPARVLRPSQPFPLLTPLPRKLELLAETGIDATLILPFTTALSQMSAHDFAQTILKQTIHVTEVHEGENFRFGHRAQAGVATAENSITSLEALGRELGFGVRVYAPRTLRGAAISSSRVRTLVAAGALGEARALLGRPFSIDSAPAPGRGYGTRYTVPTINLSPYADILPAHGVYVTTVTIGAGPAAETFDSVTNIGNRPTFGADSFAVESHLLNFHPLEGDQALTEQTPLRLTFLRRLRPEIKFPTPEALLTQITHDVTHARRYFTLCSKLT